MSILTRLFTGPSDIELMNQLSDLVLVQPIGDGTGRKLEKTLRQMYERAIENPAAHPVFQPVFKAFGEHSPSHHFGSSNNIKIKLRDALQEYDDARKNDWSKLVLN